MPRNNRRHEPTAPPIDLMPDSRRDSDPSRNWGPPPRYEDAIGEDSGLSNQPPEGQTPIQATPRLPSPTSQETNNVRHVRGTHEPHQMDHRLQRYSSHTGSLTNIDNRQNRNDTRYRSASRAETNSEDGAREGSQECSIDANEDPKKKRSSGSKIKKGLESIAFFIIQILD